MNSLLGSRLNRGSFLEFEHQSQEQIRSAKLGSKVRKDKYEQQIFGDTGEELRLMRWSHEPHSECLHHLSRMQTQRLMPSILLDYCINGNQRSV